MNPSTVFYVHWHRDIEAWVASSPDTDVRIKFDDSPSGALWALRDYMARTVDGKTHVQRKSN